MKLIEDANQQALTRILEGEPRLIDIVPARQLIPGLRERMILHAGPPISWDRMCGPMRGAVAGAIVFEGWAKDLLAATKLAASGEIEFHPNHHFGAVGPMTGMTTMSMPLFVVENARFANRAYCAINEGLGKVMRFGGNDASVLKRLAWLRDVFGPTLGKAIRAAGGIDLKSIVARGLSMGDELHQRNLACSSVFLREIAPWMARTSTDNAVLAECLAFIGQNDQFFLNIAMAMGKAITDPANGIRGSTIVTTMCRNGTDFGIHNPVWISRFTDMTRQAVSYRRQRVLLAGDAAHVHPPMGGQGLNIGVQDAVNLGWKLAQVVKLTSPDSLLDSYQTERHPVAARVLRNTMAHVALNRTDARSKALSEVVSELLRMEEPRRRFAAMMSGLDLHYELGDGHPLLGRRMPDLDLVTASGPRRVFALLHQARPALRPGLEAR